MAKQDDPLFRPLELPCGMVLDNRIAKSAMSDSLGDGTGHPTDAQCRLYERWAEGRVGLSIIGEVQGSPHFAEKPGNLVLDPAADLDRFRVLARSGASRGQAPWLQLGHAGAMTYPPAGTPKGPSALDLPGLQCEELARGEIARLPGEFARTAGLAQEVGFAGVEIHAAHGFLLSQFLSPLFNRRTDEFGGSIDARMRLLLETIEAVREAVGPQFPIAVKLNASDQLEGGLVETEALAVVRALDQMAIDLIDISGGTYFPGAKSASDSAGEGPYFIHFAEAARPRTEKPLMLTGGFKTRKQAIAALESGAIDVVGLARAFVLEPELPKKWREEPDFDPVYPRFDNPPEGGVTAWYTMALTAIAEGREKPSPDELAELVQAYESRDRERTSRWNDYFERPPEESPSI